MAGQVRLRLHSPSEASRSKSGYRVEWGSEYYWRLQDENSTPPVRLLITRCPTNVAPSFLNYRLSEHYFLSWRTINQKKHLFERKHENKIMDKQCYFNFEMYLYFNFNFNNRNVGQFDSNFDCLEYFNFNFDFNMPCISIISIWISIAETQFFGHFHLQSYEQ